VRDSERLVDMLTDAVLDGVDVDWAAAESSADEDARPLIQELRVLAAVVALHRDTTSGGGAADHWGHLRIIEPIGRGAFGEVYRAWDTRLDREVALKLLPALHAAGDPAASSIIAEGRLLARVRHPNVVTIYGAEQIDDRIGLWMECVRGRTLEQILEQRTVLNAAEVVEIGLQLADAVSAVHNAGLLHRDIKAQNVVRSEDGRIVLMDFGTGRESADDESSDLTGTPLYLAPEVLRGEPASVRSDVYSLGVVLYHLLTGVYPIHARTVAQVRDAHARGDRTAVNAARRDVPSKVAGIVVRAIEADPAKRYPSADALRAHLAEVKLRPNAVRWPYAVGAAAALILAAILAWTSERNIAVPDQPVIAVLPLKNLSAEPDSDYFVDGLTDEIIRNLAVIEGLAVRSRTSSFVFKDKPRSLRDVAEQLGANLIVEGSVLRAGDRLRINVQLVQTAGDVPVWSERFDRDLKDVFAIQDEIARAIVNKLRLTLGTGRRRYETNLDAYELYLKARALVDRRGIGNAQQAAVLFEQVIAKDAAFAPAHAGVANAYAFMSTPYRGIPFATAYPIMKAAAATALQLDPLLAEAHAAMGWVYSYERDFVRAEKAFQQAIRLDRTLTQIATSYSFSTLQPLGRHDDSMRVLQAAALNDPLSLDVQREVGEVQLAARRYEDSIATFRRIEAIDPDFPFIHTYLARALVLAGKVPEPAVLVKAGAMGQAQTYLLTGDRAAAGALAATLDNPYSEAMVYSAMGDRQRAFAAVQQVAAIAPHRLGRLLMAPELAVFRDDSRLAALRKNVGLP